MRALDLFAGTGWGVACQRLGIEEMGVEIMPEAIATREANGMKTVYHDVWDGLDAPRLAYELLIASPPCQTFSLAGKGAGRKALDEVIEAITTGAYRDPARLRQFGEDHDPRTALVLTPLAHVFRDMPMFVAFEQVPTVLPVWEACAEVMRGWGYSVKVANLHAEQYGVPQTRKRAILVARRDGVEVQLPTPTHSKYYSTNPTKLDEGVLPWVSMAEALGWGMTERPSMTVAAGGATTGGAEPFGTQASARMGAEWRRGAWGDDSRIRLRNGKDEKFAIGIDVAEAAALQSYPTDWTICHGVQKNSARRPIAEPSATMAFGNDSASVGFAKIDVGSHLELREAKRDGRFQPITVEQASTLQSYPTEPPFVWCGTKGKRFLQIGNAVPPLLAQHVLTALTQAAEVGLEDAA